MRKRLEFGTIHVYDLNRRLVDIYPDVSTLVRERQMNPQRVRSILRGETHTTKGHYLLGEDDYPTETDRQLQLKEIERRNQRRSLNRSVVAYDLHGNRQGVYSSVYEASGQLAVSTSDISLILRGKKPMAKGYVFACLEVNQTLAEQDAEMKGRIEQHLLNRPQYSHKVVHQYTLAGEHLATFSSVAEAARQLGLRAANIRNCKAGVTRKTGDFLFVPALEDDAALQEMLDARVRSLVKPSPPPRVPRERTNRSSRLRNIHHFDKTPGRYFGRYDDHIQAMAATGVSELTLHSITSGRTLIGSAGIFLLEADHPDALDQLIEVERRFREKKRLKDARRERAEQASRKDKWIALLTLDEEQLNVYKSVQVAAHENQLHPRLVKEVLQGKRDHVGGKVFRYIDRPLNEGDLFWKTFRNDDEINPNN